MSQKVQGSRPAKKLSAEIEAQDWGAGTAGKQAEQSSISELTLSLTLLETTYANFRTKGSSRSAVIRIEYKYNPNTKDSYLKIYVSQPTEADPRDVKAFGTGDLELMEGVFVTKMLPAWK